MVHIRVCWIKQWLPFILLTRFLHAAGEVTLDPPLGVNEEGDLVVEAGSVFSLTCRGDAPLRWETGGDYLANSGETRSEVSVQQKEEHGQFVSVYTVQNAYFLDTGFITCYPQGKDNPSQSIYVYVKDPENLLAINDTYQIITAHQGEVAVLPCRPTDPSLEVQLMKDGEEMKPGVYQGVRVKYDKHSGFTLMNLSLKYHALYQCPTFRNSTEVVAKEVGAFYLIVLRKRKVALGMVAEVPDTTYDPYIGFSFSAEMLQQSGDYECIIKDYSFYIQLHINIRSKTSDIERPHIIVVPSPVVEGMNVTLNCSVHYDVGVAISLYWTYPQHLNAHGRLVMHELQSEDLMSGGKLTGRLGWLPLELLDVTQADQGDYTCHVEDHSNNTHHSTHPLKVIKGKTLELTFRGNSKSAIIVQPNQKNVQLVVNINAYPAPKITQWYDNNNNLIIEDQRTGFVVTKSDSGTKLMIQDPELHHSGNYTLVVDNGEYNRSISVTIQVQGAPDVMVNGGRPDGFYLVDQEHHLECDVFGFPRPNISWFFRACRDYPKCDLAPVFIPPAQYLEMEINNLRGMLKSIVRIRVNLTGDIFCVAANNLGFKNDSTTVLATDVPNGFSVEGPSLVVESDNLTLSCGASKYRYMDDPKWFYSENYGPPAEINDLSMWREETKYSSFVNLNIPNVNKNHTGNYSCVVRQRFSRNTTITTSHRDYIMKVENLEKPVISKENVNTTRFVKSGTTVIFHCGVRGTPPPSVRWFKDKSKVENSSKFELLNNNETLSIHVGLEEDGVYHCLASNKAGQDMLAYRIDVMDKTNKYVFIFFVYILPVLVVLALVMALLYARRVCKLRKEIRELKEAGLLNFEEGNVECLNPELDVGEQADLLPYDRKKWEFPRDKLKLGKQLGSGAFGVVMKADAYELQEQGVATTVAVKMVKRNSDVMMIKALAAELKIMIHLGRHLNVVNVLGACTGDLNKRELLVLVEYCQYGNMHNYLLKHRGAFINQVNSRTGTFDPTLIQPTSPTSPNSRFSDAFTYSNGKVSMRTSAAVSAATDTTMLASDMSEQPRPKPLDSSNTSIESTPIGEDGYVLSRDHEWRSRDRGDYQETAGLRPVCTQDLICWGFQIARGMEYLASRKVLHGDLAARNVLLADDNIVKICDFGFSKSMYTDGCYQKKGDGPLPIKWMALESIRDRVFSTQSDVWAYGITLWEMFSLARTPYPGMEVDAKLFNRLEEGYRMEQPKYSTKQVYRVMLDCWHVNPNTRPSFTELAERMGGMLEDTVRTHYVDLNDPFLQENTEFLAQQDYLSMLRSPSYANWNPPTPDGYSVMKPVKPTEDAMELTPMLDQYEKRTNDDSPDGSPTITKPIGNNYVNVVQVLGFSNPIYHNLDRPKQSPYINMPDSSDES